MFPEGLGSTDVPVHTALAACVPFISGGTIISCNEGGASVTSPSAPSALTFPLA